MTDSRFALPTLEESQQLRQAESIVHGNLVQMECEELLHELAVDYTALPQVEQALFSLRAALLTAPARVVRARDPTEAGTDTAPVAQPIDLPEGTAMRRWTTDTSSRRATSTVLDFSPPVRVELMGSFQLRTLARPRCVVDVAVHMPASCFMRKDLLDYRYHDKRLLYVTCLHDHLRGASEGGSGGSSEEEEEAPAASSLYRDVRVVGFHSKDDLSTKPILAVAPATTGQWSGVEQSFTFRIHVCLDPTTFDTGKLSTTSGNLRIHRHPTTGDRLPTPRYNCSVLEDMYYPRHLRGLHAFSRSLHNPDSFCECAMLLKVW